MTKNKLSVKEIHSLKKIDDYQSFLKRALEIADVGFWHIDKTKENELFWSDEIFKIYGFDKKDGLPDIERAINAYHPDDRAMVKELVSRALEEGEDYRFVVRLIRPDGETRYVESFGECEKNDAGEVQAVFGVFKDITEHKLREQQAKDAKHTLSRIIENLPDYVFVKDEEFRIVQANQSFIELYPEDQRDKVIGYTTVEHYDEKEAEQFLERDRRAFETGYCENLEEINFPDGSTKTLLTKKVAYNDSGHKFVVGIARDLTDMIDLQNKLMQSNIELERFAYLASHDLQEPLRMIKSFTQLLKEDNADKLDETSNEYMDYTIKAATRMQDLISDLLHYSRLGHEKDELSVIDCNDKYEIALDNLSRLIKHTNAVITSDDLPSIKFNGLNFVSLLQNLIGNALKYRRKDISPIIHVGVEDKNNHWLFSVSDNGIGMAEKHTKKIFDIFQRLHSKEDYGGTGIGLSICKKIVEYGGGEIWVESKPNKGSCFYFTLPKNQISE